MAKQQVKEFSTLTDLKNMLKEDADDLKPVDFIDLCDLLLDAIAAQKMQAQDKIDAEMNRLMESIRDSFGGKEASDSRFFN